MNSTHQLSGHSLDYNAGAYGRDGAPAQKFMSSIAPAHRQPSPQRPNIAPSERSLPPMDRLSPSPHTGPRAPPIYAISNLHVASLDPKLSAPKAAFLEPSSPTSHTFESISPPGLIHGESEKISTGDEFYSPGARRKDLDRAEQENSSSWLQKQSKAGSKFKTVTWIVAVIALLIIGALIAKIVTKKPSPVTSPAPLKWANGSNRIPTFGANGTTTAVATDTTKSTTTASNTTHNSATPSKLANAKRNLVVLD